MSWKWTIKLATVLLVVSASLFTADSSAEGPAELDADVLIIGAGLAGATLAYELSSHNVSFKILEASSEAGGRMRQHRLTDDIVLEEGANWVQGFVKGDPFSDFVSEKVGLRMVASDFDDMYFVRDGKLVPDSEADPVWERLDRAMKHVYKLFNESRNADGTTRFDMSLKSALLSEAGWLPLTDMDVMALRNYMDFEYAVPPSEISIHELSIFYDPGRRPKRSDMFVTDKRGFSAVVDWHLRKAGVTDLQNGDEHLLLNANVNRVRYGKRWAQVALRDGRKFYGRAVVSTVPLGVLQYSLLQEEVRPKGTIEFRPRLPRDKRVAIAKMELSDYTKLFLRFRTSVVTKDHPEHMVPLECTEAGFISLHNLEKRGHFPGKNLVLLTGTNVLSRELACLSEREVLDRALRYVSLAVGRTVRRWEVANMHKTAWFANPLSRGAYSTGPPGMTDEDYDALDRRVGALFFSGEVHSPLLHGYVQGAWESGMKSAKDVVRFLS